MITKKMPNDATIYYCKKCDFKCSKNSNYTKHLLTRKHIMITNDNEKMPHENKESVDIFTCNCGNIYKYKSGLSRHKLKCKNINGFQSNEKEKETEHDFGNKNIEMPPIYSYTIVSELIKQNEEFKELLMEQNKHMMELASESKIINNTNSHNTFNNRFNLNVFLNEQCKDAMNLSDFLNNIEVSLEDVSNVGRLGYADGISRIIINALKDMDVYERPIHCSDIKREIMYIKENDIWEKDDERKYQMKRVLKLISHKNVKRLLDWREAHPGWLVYDSKEEAECLRITNESMGGGSDEENERLYKKMIRKIAHETLIDKKLVE